MKKIIIFSVLALGFCSACGFLDKDPHTLTDGTYYRTESDLRNALTGVYSPLMQEQFYGENYLICHAGGDDLSFYQRSSPRISMATATASSTTADIMTFWRILYEGINRANTLLENADMVQNIAPATLARIKAEAYFLRSFYYFNLVQCWGDVPLILESTKSAENLSVARTDKQIVYDRIIEDIEDNLRFLPKANEVSTPERVSQSAAQGILARIYLFRAGEHFRDGKAEDPKSAEYFERASYWASQVIASGFHDLADDYTQVFKDLAADKYNSTGKYESIFEVAEAGNRLNNMEYSAGKVGSVFGFGLGNDFSSNPEFADKKGMENPGYSQRAMFASLKLYRMYYRDDPENIDRVRGDWNIASYEYLVENNRVTGREYYYPHKPAGLDEVDGLPCTERPEAQSKVYVRCMAKYRREYEQVTPKAKFYTPINFPVLRYSDVLLMFAEAENEVNGPDALAYMCIDKVRTRVGLNPLAEGLSKEEFRECVKKERAMELCFEGLRRWDLIRWGEFYDTMMSMEALVADSEWPQTYKYAANYYKVTPAYVYFPIPDWEMTTNNKMVQNVGW